MLFPVLVVLTACTIPQAIVRATRPVGDGTFVLFLDGPAKTPFSMTLDLAAVQAARADGIFQPVLNRPLSIDSLKVVERQVLIAETFLPPGRYRRLQVRIPKARLKRGDQAVDLSVREEAFDFNVDFEITSGGVTPLFMNWDVEQSIEAQVFLRPAFGFAGRNNQLPAVLAYVTNEDSNSVTVIDRSSDRVIDVLEVGSRPRGIVYSPRSSRAFVVNSGSNNMTVIDVKTNKILHTVNLESASNPTEIAIHPDGRILYVANTALNSVSVIDANSFQTIGLISVGQRPVALALDASGARLLVVNSGANTVSVIDTARNRTLTTLPVEFQPVSISVDPVGNRAFVTHLRSTRMSVLSLNPLRVESRMITGPATDVLPDENPRRVFVAQVSGDRLGLFDVNIDAELASVPVGKDPNRLALDADRNKVYVVNRGSDSVTVIDKNSRLVYTEIPTTKRPFGIAIIR